MEKYYRQFYTPANILITAAGSLEHRKLVKLAEQYFGDLKRRKTIKIEEKPTPHAPLVFRDQGLALEQVHVYLGVPSIAMPHKERFACYILNAVLGGGMSSRLFQNIREKQGLAYTVFSELTMYHDAGCMLIYAGTALKSAGKVVESIVRERRPGGSQGHRGGMRRAKDHFERVTCWA